MTATTSANSSLWLDTAPAATYPVLAGDLSVDVAVVGGGITGLTTALLLRRAGATVAVLEAAAIGSGVTGCTTAKVSALQATLYTTIGKHHDPATVAAYAQASMAGVEQVAALAAEESIDCDLARRDAITYAAIPDERAALEAEADAVRRAGLPIEFVETADLPLPTHGAIQLADQLQIHPVRYTQGLAAALTIENRDSYVFENTRVVGVEEGKPCRVRTLRGFVTAEHVVIATHYPILDRGLYFARLAPQRSYCIAARPAAGPLPSGMAINAGRPTRSVRSSAELIIIGGEGHPTGASDATPERFARLEQFARQHWNIESVTHRWSAQDPVSYDHLPFIGPYRPGASRLWVAAGFMKWGLATATFAAQLLTDRINGRPGQWADTFSPNRISPRSLPRAAQLGAKVGGDLIGDRLRLLKPADAEDVAAGRARIVRDRRSPTGVYRDPDGRLHAVSARCPHMGCLLRFNHAETSWDCPCHGSRFDVDGQLLEGPAVDSLEQGRP
ncbi:MAG TPA: FAD-dependent oxidoreductase [Mycobacterium sp.]|jgi:glycine/D-amino acid oxidase-like deaminating enzyme/nitrite reductase/ring-hydroxylating ferredoxin subunit|nr:FAD-dependent oxidoreductase [Mycobacterium sp.]